MRQTLNYCSAMNSYQMNSTEEQDTGSVSVSEQRGTTTSEPWYAVTVQLTPVILIVVSIVIITVANENCVQCIHAICVEAECMRECVGIQSLINFCEDESCHSFLNSVSDSAVPFPTPLLPPLSSSPSYSFHSYLLLHILLVCVSSLLLKR